jgi:hypothetical protein
MTDGLITVTINDAVTGTSVHHLHLTAFPNTSHEFFILVR